MSLKGYQASLWCIVSMQGKLCGVSHQAVGRVDDIVKVGCQDPIGTGQKEDGDR